MTRQTVELEITVKGSEEFVRSSARAAARLQAMKEVNAEIARRAARTAAGYAPARTGALRGSIRGRGIKAGARISSRLIYAPIQEWGWPGHNIAPRRFFGRTIADGGWFDSYEQELERAIDTITGA